MLPPKRRPPPGAAFSTHAMEAARSAADGRNDLDLSVEIRQLRDRLRVEGEDAPDAELMLKGLSVLIRAVVAQYRIRKHDAGELQAILERATAEFRSELMPDGEEDL